MLKVCSTCDKELSTDCFTPCKRNKSGFRARCKSCESVHRKSRVGCTKSQEYTRSYYKANSEKILSDPRSRERSLKWAKDNREKHNEKNRKWSSLNKGYTASLSANKRAKKINATPDWLTGPQIAHIKRTYKLSALMKDITGVVYHVDHIVPLNGENVCGLHVPWNLQVLRADLNLSKSNKTLGDTLNGICPE